MPKYWIMFHATQPGSPIPTIYQTSRFDNTEGAARSWFSKTHPDGTIIHVRKVKQFTQSEMRKERDILKFKK